MTEKKKQPWWKNAVVYQIYPKSFQDSNGDGIGDIRGIISRLDYLADLGIDAVWISPMYCSPQDDNGYDISDYQDIDPMFGTLSDMEELIAEAKKRNIRIIMDLVLNHTSDEHRWFLEAKKGKDNPYHDYYVWRDGVEGELPNDMKATFGGPAWEWVPELKQYYFHQFSVKQPDLNWENPKVRREIYDMILWWMDKGVGVLDRHGQRVLSAADGRRDQPGPGDAAQLPVDGGICRAPDAAVQRAAGRRAQAAVLLVLPGPCVWAVRCILCVDLVPGVRRWPISLRWTMTPTCGR